MRSTQGGSALIVTFYGVRGSTPCSCAENRRYGGNTACVVVEGDDQHRPIVMDLGTGLRFYGLTQPQDGTFSGIGLVSHLHWDHVQGLPFFTPVLKAGSEFDLYIPAQDDGRTVEEAMRTFLSPPYFPVTIDALPGRFSFTEVRPGTFPVDDDTQVTAAWVPHIGPTMGYRVSRGGFSVAYLSDHQQPGCRSTFVDPSVVELCRGVDLLIHDAQYTEGEFALRPDWGHCTVDYAVEVAVQSQAKRLALFHHDPGHHDSVIDEQCQRASHLAAAGGVGEVFAASEGMSVSLGEAVAR